jgi:large subunit ribosomal protein L17
MRHLKAHRKLGRTSEHRNSMLRNLATSLINARDERIVTTLPKAKELRPFVERAITLSRRARTLSGEGAEVRALHLRRQAAGFFHAGNMTAAVASGKRGQVRPERTAGVAALKRLFGELGERYVDRAGGYTRIFKLGHREGDRAELAIIELVDNPREKEALEAAKKRAKGGATKKKKSPETKKTAGRAQASETGKADTVNDTATHSDAEQESESSEENK